MRCRRLGALIDGARDSARTDTIMMMSSSKYGAILTLARGVVALTASLAAVLWVYAMWMPGTEAILSGWSFAVAALMMIFALLAVIAAVKSHLKVMLAMFLGSFLPVGAYLIRVDHWLHWVGIVDLIWLGATLTGLVAAKRSEG